MNPVPENSPLRFGEPMAHRNRAAWRDAWAARAIAGVGNGVGLGVMLGLAILVFEGWPALASRVAGKPSAVAAGPVPVPSAGHGTGIDLSALGWGSLRITAVALLGGLLVAVPLAIVAARRGPGIAPGRFRAGVRILVGSFAGVPWVVLGFVAVTVLGPNVPLNGWGMGAAVGLALLPRVFSMTEDALASVPQASVQAALALGATPSEVIHRVMLPSAVPGIGLAVLAVLGHALVETMIGMGLGGHAPTSGWSLWDAVPTTPVAWALGGPETALGRVVPVLMPLAMFPLGVLAGIHLAEYTSSGTFWPRLWRRVFRGLECIPAAVFGGGVVFELGLGLGGSVPGLANGSNGWWPHMSIAGLAWVVGSLPTVVVASEAALRAVPPDLRASAIALGATRLEVLSRILLPNALPGIVRGMALALGRVAGGLAPWLLAVVAARGSTTPSDRSGDPAAGWPTLFAVLWILVFLSILLNAAAAMLRSRTFPTAADRD